VQNNVYEREKEQKLENNTTNFREKEREREKKSKTPFRKEDNIKSIESINSKYNIRKHDRNDIFCSKNYIG